MGLVSGGGRGVGLERGGGREVYNKGVGLESGGVYVGHCRWAGGVEK